MDQLVMTAVLGWVGVAPRAELPNHEEGSGPAFDAQMTFPTVLTDAVVPAMVQDSLPPVAEKAEAPAEGEEVAVPDEVPAEAGIAVQVVPVLPVVQGVEGVEDVEDVEDGADAAPDDDSGTAVWADPADLPEDSRVVSFDYTENAIGLPLVSQPAAVVAGFARQPVGPDDPAETRETETADRVPAEEIRKALSDPAAITESTDPAAAAHRRTGFHWDDLPPAASDKWLAPARAGAAPSPDIDGAIRQLALPAQMDRMQPARGLALTRLAFTFGRDERPEAGLLPFATGPVPAAHLSGPAVAMAHAPFAPPIQPLSQQVTDAVLRMQDDRIEIMLNPEEMGSVRLVLSRGEAAATLTVWVERPEVLEALRRNAEAMQADLKGSGLADARLDFRDGSDGQGGAFRESADHQRQAADLTIGLAGGSGLTAGQGRSERVMRGLDVGRLDIRV